MSTPRASSERDVHVVSNVGWVWVGTGVVLALGPGDPTREGWHAYLEANDRRLESRREISGVLVLPIETAAPNAGQRAELREHLRKHAWNGPVAMVVSNPVALTVARLISMISDEMKPFSPDAFDRAVDHAKLTGFRDDAERAGRELWRELSGGKTAFTVRARR